MDVDNERFQYWWEKSKPLLVKALHRSGDLHTIDDVFENIRTKKAIFYPLKDGAAIFTFREYPRRRLLQIWLVGGDMEASIEGVLAGADFYAEQNGCDGIEVIGRKGWKRVLEPYGYDYKSIVMIKDIGD